jgi:hypothetical protein
MTPLEPNAPSANGVVELCVINCHSFALINLPAMGSSSFIQNFTNAMVLTMKHKNTPTKIPGFLFFGGGGVLSKFRKIVINRAEINCLLAAGQKIGE